MNKKPPSAARKTTTTRRPVSVSARTSPADDLRSALRALVPAAFPGGEFRPDELAKILSTPTHPDAASDAGGRGGWGGWGGWEGDDGNRYRFDWAGRREAFARHAGRASGTLAPDLRRSADFFAARNVYIEAENLEALKILSRAYAGRVKMIYIDPPYNTGNDFVYNDKFAVGGREYMAAAGMLDGRGRAKSARAREEVRMMNGHKHSAWLTMMWPRLMAARSLLADDGVIFVSIDDNEVHHLRLLMNMVFGEENFVANFVVQSNSSGAKFGLTAVLHEFVLCYAKNRDEVGALSLPLGEKTLAQFEGEDGGKKYRLIPLLKSGAGWRKEDRPKMHYPLYVNPDNGKVSVDSEDGFSVKVVPVRPSTGEDGRWTWGIDRARKDSNLLAAQAGKGGWRIFRKDFLEEDNGDRKRSKIATILQESDFFYTRGIEELKSLLGDGEIFPLPKPVPLIKRLIQSATGKGDIVLDFFSGSATTAHAVMELNAEDGGERRFVSVQWPEATPENSLARRKGYKTIAAIGRERLIRAGKKIRESANGNMFAAESDVGFRYFRWSESAVAKWPPVPESADAEEWTRLVESRKKLAADAEPLSVLTEAMLREGWPLCARIEEKTAEVPGDDGETIPCRVFHVTTPENPQGFHFCPEPSVPIKIGRALGMGRDDLLICREDAVDDDVATTIVRRHRLKVI